VLPNQEGPAHPGPSRRLSQSSPTESHNYINYKHFTMSNLPQIHWTLAEN
jgi:hypothetical protein